MSIKKVITYFINKIRDSHLRIKYEKREKSLLQLNNYPTGVAKGEMEWEQYWKPIAKSKNPFAYRLYSHFCGPSKYILSELVTIDINRTLNPVGLSYYYSDKNLFDRILPKGVLPKTILRKMGAVYRTADYELVELSPKKLDDLLKPYSQVILKPSVVSDSGKGIILFKRDSGGCWKSHDGKSELNVKFLGELEYEIILQEALQQNDFMKMFNPTSVNTIRIATYKSVKDDQVHILSAVIRMGAKDSIVDNLHNGGDMVRINEDGSLADHCVNAEGSVFGEHGDINFKNNTFTVPDWDRIQEFAKKVASYLIDIRLLQLDIMVDICGNPRLIEYNINGFSMWIAQMTGSPALGRFTDEIREFTIANISDRKIKMF